MSSLSDNEDCTAMSDSEDEIEALSLDDPFILHFNRNIPKEKITEEKIIELEDISNWERKLVTWPHNGRMEVKLPLVDKTPIVRVKRQLDDDYDLDATLPTIGVMPDPHSKAFDSLLKGFVDKKILKTVNSKAFSAFQSEIFTIISNYMDFWHAEAVHDKWEKIRRVYSIHCLNHLIKAKKLIKKNNKKSKLEPDNECPQHLEDQGFTSPRVLILLPFKHSAYRVVKIMASLLGLKKATKKFEAEFGPPEENKNEVKNKPEDFYKIFAGDISEDFRIGISVMKNSLNIMNDKNRNVFPKSFHKCDMIIASPLGMRYMLEVANENREKNILSSIEIVVMDQADIFLMQNWEHILIILDALNNFPDDIRGIPFDMFRVHGWHLDKLARYYRQTLIFSSTSSDYIRDVIAKSRNFAGKITLYNRQRGILHDLKVRVDLTMLRINKSDQDLDYFDARFVYFTKELVPMLRKNLKTHVLIYIPDHFDYVRLAAFFKSDGGTDVSTINEYMIQEEAKVAKARSLFFSGKRAFLLYTERYHFYKRTKIKGVRHVVFYSPPTFPHYFKEICEMMSEELQNPKEVFSGLSIIYLPYQSEDTGKLVELIGTSKMIDIEKSGKNYHSYLTGINL